MCANATEPIVVENTEDEQIMDEGKVMSENRGSVGDESPLDLKVSVVKPPGTFVKSF